MVTCQAVFERQVDRDGCARGRALIRITAAKAAAAADGDADEPLDGKLGALLQNAVVMGDSHGLADRAAVILDGALERTEASASPIELLEALAYRAELAARSGDLTTAADVLARARAVQLSAAERDRADETLAAMDDLEVVIGQPPD